MAKRQQQEGAGAGTMEQDETDTEPTSRQINYEVLTKCYGFTDDPGVPSSFRTRLWRKGEHITLDAKVRVPRHFHDLTKPTPQQAREKKRAINSRKVRRISNPEYSK